MVLAEGLGLNHPGLLFILAYDNDVWTQVMMVSFPYSFGEGDHCNNVLNHSGDGLVLGLNTYRSGHTSVNGSCSKLAM